MPDRASAATVVFMLISKTAASRLFTLGIGSALTVCTMVLPAVPATAGITGVTAAIAGGDLQIGGGGRDDAITIRLRAGNPTAIEVMTGLTRFPEFVFRRADVERISIATADGADRVTVDDRFGVVGAGTPVTITTGDGDDTVTGGAGDEVVLAGSGADTVDGGAGDDELFLGSGDDQVRWDPADGSDTVEGQTGADQVVADGTTAADHLEIAANGSRLKLFRPGQPGAVDASGIDDWSIRPGAGADTVIVNDLTGAPAAVLEWDLDVAGGGNSDGSPDTVEVAGTPGADQIGVDHDGDALEVTGTPSRVRITGADRLVDRVDVDADLGSDTLRSNPVVGALMAVRLAGGPGQDTVAVEGTAGKDNISVEAADDRIRVNQAGNLVDATAENMVINGLGGDDQLRATANLDPLTHLTLNGGPGADSLNGGDGVELLIGGDGNDQVIGKGGDDVLLLGADQDNSFWFPGDGDDVVEGGGGSDAVQIVGGSGPDHIDVSPVGNRVRVLQNTDRQDTNDVERLSLHPLRGSDQVSVHTLSGTDLFEVTADLGATVGGAGDGESDQVVFDLTNGNDSIALVGDSDHLSAQGLTWSPRVRHTDGLLDRLTINTLAGADPVTTSGVVPGTITLSIV